MASNTSKSGNGYMVTVESRNRNQSEANEMFAVISELEKKFNEKDTIRRTLHGEENALWTEYWDTEKAANELNAKHEQKKSDAFDAVKESNEAKKNLELEEKTLSKTRQNEYGLSFSDAHDVAKNYEQWAPVDRILLAKILTESFIDKEQDFSLLSKDYLHPFPFLAYNKLHDHPFIVDRSILALNNHKRLRPSKIIRVEDASSLDEALKSFSEKARNVVYQKGMVTPSEDRLIFTFQPNSKSLDINSSYEYSLKRPHYAIPFVAGVHLAWGNPDLDFEFVLGLLTYMTSMLAYSFSKDNKSLGLIGAAPEATIYPHKPKRVTQDLTIHQYAGKEELGDVINHFANRYEVGRKGKVNLLDFSLKAPPKAE